MSQVLAHVGAFPLEEIAASFGPALFMVCAATVASLRAHWRRTRQGVRRFRR